MERKLSGYCPEKRRDDWPVLFVVANDRTESVFHEVAGSSGLRMLTATVGRAAFTPVVGGEGCWLEYGRPVSVG